MDFAQLSSLQITELVKLVGEKQRIVAQIASIDGKLSQLGTSGFSSSPSPKAKPSAAKTSKAKAPSKTKAPKAKRGAMKEAILAVLKDAPAEGFSAAEIASKAGLKAPSVGVWLVTTGKTVSEIQKVGRGRYALGQSVVSEPAVVAGPAPEQVS